MKILSSRETATVAALFFFFKEEKGFLLVFSSPSLSFIMNERSVDYGCGFLRVDIVYLWEEAPQPSQMLLRAEEKEGATNFKT